MSARHRVPCRACGRPAHPGETIERIFAAAFNAGVAALITILRVPPADTTRPDH